jgi:hypothetical protein
MRLIWKLHHFLNIDKYEIPWGARIVTMTQNSPAEELEAALAGYGERATQPRCASVQSHENECAAPAPPRPDSARDVLKRFLVVGVAVTALAASGYFAH